MSGRTAESRARRSDEIWEIAPPGTPAPPGFGSLLQPKPAAGPMSDRSVRVSSNSGLEGALERRATDSAGPRAKPSVSTSSAPSSRASRGSPPSSGWRHRPLALRPGFGRLAKLARISELSSCSARAPGRVHHAPGRQRLATPSSSARPTFRSRLATRQCGRPATSCWWPALSGARRVYRRARADGAAHPAGLAHLHLQ